MKLTKEQRAALAERIHENAIKQAKEYNKKLKEQTPELNPDQEKFVEDAFQHFNAIPDIFIDYIVGGKNGMQRPSKQDLKDAIIDTLDGPPEKRVLAEKTIYNRLLLTDVSKFTTLDEIEKSFNAFEN